MKTGGGLATSITMKTLPPQHTLTHPQKTSWSYFHSETLLHPHHPAHTLQVVDDNLSVPAVALGLALLLMPSAAATAMVL